MFLCSLIVVMDTGLGEVMTDGVGRGGGFGRWGEIQSDAVVPKMIYTVAARRDSWRTVGPVKEPEGHCRSSKIRKLKGSVGEVR